MHIDFSNVEKNFIKNEVKSGFYQNEADLIREAVRRMKEEKEHNKRFSEAVAKGTQAIMRGEIVHLTSDLLREIKLEATYKSQNSISYCSSDAIPKST